MAIKHLLLNITLNEFRKLIGIRQSYWQEKCGMFVASLDWISLQFCTFS